MSSHFAHRDNAEQAFGESEMGGYEERMEKLLEANYHATMAVYEATLVLTNRVEDVNIATLSVADNTQRQE